MDMKMFSTARAGLVDLPHRGAVTHLAADQAGAGVAPFHRNAHDPAPAHNM
jgi:hypothetical protein